jgi:hypothetical protein
MWWLYSYHSQLGDVPILYLDIGCTQNDTDQFFNEGKLNKVLAGYVAYYNEN